MGELEKKIEGRIVDWALAHGWMVEKVKFYNSGWPDRVFISKMGVHCYIEVKRPGEEPETLQDYRMLELIKRGVAAVWVDNSDDGINWLKLYSP